MSINLNEGFQNETLANNKRQYKEKVGYLGELRIVGRIVDKGAVVGFVIMQERTKQFKPYTIEQTQSLLRKFKFVNAVYDTESVFKIKGTENALSRFTTFDTQMIPIGNPTILVLAEIHVNGSFYKYQVLDTTGKVVELTEKELIAIHEANRVDIANSKLVHKNGKKYLSANGAAFTIIQRAYDKTESNRDNSEDTTSKKDELKETDKWRHERFLTKLKNIGACIGFKKVLLGQTTDMGGIIIKSSTETYKNEFGCNIHKIESKKLVKVFCKELAKEVLETEKQKDTFKKFVEDYSKLIAELNGTHNDFSDKFKLLWFGLCQLGMLVPENRERLLKSTRFITMLANQATDEYIFKPEVNQFINSDYMLVENKVLCSQIEEMVRRAYLLKKKQEAEKNKRMFRTYTFQSAEDAAQLGYALSEKMEGYKYTTKTGRELTLKYLGRYIPNYEELKPLATCLGDLLLIANIEKFWTYSALYAGKPEQLMYDVKPELCLAILALYNPEICKAYIESRADTYDELRDMLPGFDFDNPIDYKLPEEIRLYYESGCNVYYSDFEYLDETKEGKSRKRRYIKSRYLDKADIIEYKSMGVQKRIMHKDLYDELAPIVNMITSDLCTAELINKYIGMLRAL